MMAKGNFIRFDWAINTEIPDNFTARGLKEAREQLLYDNLSDEEKKAYDHHLKQTRYEQNVIEDAYTSGRYEGEAEGLAKGEAIGLEKGRVEGLEKVVIKSRNAGYSTEAISIITGLTQEEIIHILKREIK